MPRLLLALVFVASFAAADSKVATDVTGRYHSNWDDVQLVQTGDRVTGTYVCCGGGTIEGRISEGRTLHYRWHQPGGDGLGVWTINPERLEGTWGAGQDARAGGRWDLVRIQARARIAQ